MGPRRGGGTSKCQECFGQESCRTKAPRIFRIFVRILPRILLRIFPRFFVEFSCFILWETETRKKITKKTRHFSMQISQANSKKNSINVFIFLESGKCKDCNAPPFESSKKPTELCNLRTRHHGGQKTNPHTRSRPTQNPTQTIF